MRSELAPSAAPTGSPPPLLSIAMVAASPTGEPRYARHSMSAVDELEPQMEAVVMHATGATRRAADEIVGHVLSRDERPGLG